MEETQHEVLRAIAETVVPRLERADDPHGFWARSGSEVGAHEAVAQAIDQLPEPQRAGLLQLIDGLVRMGFLSASQRSREQLLRNLAALGPEAAAGGQALIGLSLFFAYSIPDPTTGVNPFWAQFGYPGPDTPSRRLPKVAEPLVPEGDAAVYEPDAVVVGSGAGGGVIAAALAAAGQHVIVLEAGGCFEEADFTGHELWAYENLYWRGGPNPTADLNVSLWAGSGYGGGTAINWTNCLRTKPLVREQWAREHGLEGLDGSEFDRHLDTVWERLSVTDRCSDLNGTHQAMQRGADALGWSFKTITRNVSESRYSPATAGLIGFGDRSGAKQSTARTFLADARERGTELIARCSGSHCDPVASSCSRPTRWAPAAWARTRRRAWRTRTVSCTTHPGYGSATRVRFRPPRAPTR